ncbi:MAG: hypothetical protein GY845_31455 [Planctomycetes bacterium]|nr:hypothetical protein [Planctomycetota bacterium]
MWAGSTICGYIDPNTSQHVFSLLGPILAFLAVTGGLAVTGFVFVRHRIVSYFKKASWKTRIATVLIIVGMLAIVSVIVCRLIW